jgi:hypothetical protein
LLAEAIAGVFYALLTILIILINTGTFRGASLQIAVDKPTVRMALALAGLVLLNLVRGLFISLANGLIIGSSHPQ